VGCLGLQNFALSFTPYIPLISVVEARIEEKYSYCCDYNVKFLHQTSSQIEFCCKSSVQKFINLQKIMFCSPGIESTKTASPEFL